MVAKLELSEGNKKTDLSNIIKDDNMNSRKTYDPKEIEERARSIEDLSQLEPVIVQKSKTIPGKYILISGFCRYKAHELLVSEGKDYTQIEYIVKNGDPFMINLAENIQRSKLNSLDLEAALNKMTEEGKKPKEIADSLKKSVSWVCDRLKAHEIRSDIEVDTSEISSSGISHLRKLSPSEIKAAIPEIKSKGGTVKAIDNVIDKIKSNSPEDPIVENNNKDPYISIPDKDPFELLYGPLKVLVRLNISKDEILNKISIYLEGLK